MSICKLARNNYLFHLLNISDNQEQDYIVCLPLDTSFILSSELAVKISIAT